MKQHEDRERSVNDAINGEMNVETLVSAVNASQLPLKYFLTHDPANAFLFHFVSFVFYLLHIIKCHARGGIARKEEEKAGLYLHF